MKLVPWILCGALLVPSLANADDGAKETPEQASFRGGYVAKTVKRIHEIADTGNKARTPEENATISVHWGRAMRAIRIRELAQDDGDNATVGRVDGLLARLDTQFYDHLLALSSTAPDKPKAPQLEAPTAGLSVRLNEAFQCKFASYPGATAYSCGVMQPGHPAWFLHSAAPHMGFALGATNLTPGHAEVVGRVQVEHTHWTDAVRVGIELTPSDAPPPPRLERPAVAAILGIDKPVTVEFAEYPNATHYLCGIRQGGAYVKMHSGTTRECALDVHSDSPTPFHNGFAWIHGYANVNDKSTMHVTTEVDLTGAPVIPPAHLEAPTAGQTIAPDAPLTCRFAEYPGATAFHCYLMWSRGCIASAPTRSCTFDVKSLPGHPLKAGPHMMRTQVEVGQQWQSSAAAMNVTLSADAAPAPSSSAHVPPPPPPSSSASPPPRPSSSVRPPPPPPPSPSTKPPSTKGSAK